MMVQRKHKNELSSVVRNESSKNSIPEQASSFLPISHPTAHAMQYGYEQIPVYAQPQVQPKLQVNQPLDASEKQADGMSEKVMQQNTDTSLFDPVKADVQNGTILNDGLINKITSSQGGGQPIEEKDNSFMSGRFGIDFSQVKIHAGNDAANMNDELHARAFTAGNDIYFNKGEYEPHTQDGKKLMAHELTHVAQQRNSVSEIQRKPADLKLSGRDIPYDEDKIKIQKITDFSILTIAGGITKYANDPQSTAATTTDPAIKTFKWQVYDPSDVLVNDSYLKSTLTIGSRVSSKYPTFFASDFVNNAKQGRYIIRCTGYDSSDAPVAYAEESFFVWMGEPLGQKNLGELNTIKSNPAGNSFGELGAANARSMMLEHQEAIRKTGTGTVAGNQCGTPAPAGTAAHDCTTYVLSVLESTFKSKGLTAVWDKVFKDAQKNSGTAFKGTELIKSLVNIGGWKAVFWSPDPRNPNDSLPEHPTAYKNVQRSGKYYGIDVDNTKSVVDYRKTSPQRREDMSNLDKLKKIPLAVIAAKGGMHMTLLVQGVVYEVHWDLPATDPNVIQATPLEQWGWNSGVIVVPDADFKVAFP